MSEVTRYKLDIDCLYPDKDGEYVLASDYDEMADRAEAAEADFLAAAECNVEQRKTIQCLQAEMATERLRADAAVGDANAAEQRVAELEALSSIFQTWLGASRSQCDESGQRLWDRIENSLAGQPQQGEKICTHPEGCTHCAWCGFKAERPAAIPDATELAEAAARMVYESWSEEPGYVAWAEGGNSFKQDKARAIAKRIVSALRDAKPEQAAAVDEPTAHSEDGQDERAALSTALFNALESYEAIRSAFRRKDQKIHAKQCELIRQHAAQLLTAPVAMAVVMPERMTTIPEGKTISYAAGYEDALDAVAGLNRNTMPLELLEQLRALLAQPAPAIPEGWIPVSERLPENDTPILVAYKFGGIYTCRRNVIDHDLTAVDPAHGERDRPTHWMPLPAGPHEGKSHD